MKTASENLRRFFLLPALCSGLVLLFTLLPPTIAGAGEGGLLERIGVKKVDTNYVGRKMVIDFSRLTPQVTKLTVTHQLGGKERREYHASNGLVIIDGNTFWQYFPEKKVVVKKKLPGEGGWEALRKQNLEQTLVSYKLESHPADPVAGHRTHLFEFTPYQAGSRPLRKIWVDVETGLVLRTEIYSPDSRLFWLSVFENLDYGKQVNPVNFKFSVPEGVKVVESGEERCMAPAEAEQITGLSLSLPGYTPSGFVRKCIRARSSERYNEIQVLYSDGLSLLSFFESSRSRTPLRSGRGSENTEKVGEFPGEWHSVGLVSALRWHPPWAYMTILGEVSREEILKMATSIHLNRELSRP